MNPVGLSSKDTPRAFTQPVPVSNALETLVCWRQIGVFGDRSCPELHNYIHCHNCPVHAEAGLQLLNRALPSGYRREQTNHFARQRQRREVSNFSAVLFRINTEWFALPTRVLQEAAEFKTIHSLPHRRRGSVLGLANLRGELVVCVSLPHLLGVQTAKPGPALAMNYHRLLVVHSGASRLAFPVHEVSGPHRFHTDEVNRLAAKPRSRALRSSQAVLRWQDRAIGLLDSDALLAACQKGFR